MVTITFEDILDTIEVYKRNYWQSIFFLVNGQEVELTVKDNIIQFDFYNQNLKVELKKENIETIKLGENDDEGILFIETNLPSLDYKDIHIQAVRKITNTWISNAPN